MRFVNVKSPVVFFLSGHVHLRTSDDHSEVYWDGEYLFFLPFFVATLAFMALVVSLEYVISYLALCFNCNGNVARCHQTNCWQR